MGEAAKIRVFSVDDHPLLNEAIAAIINSQPDMQLVAQATSGSDAVRQFRQHRPDITVMDLRLPDMSGIDHDDVSRCLKPNQNWYRFICYSPLGCCRNCLRPSPLSTPPPGHGSRRCLLRRHARADPLVKYCF